MFASRSRPRRHALMVLMHVKRIKPKHISSNQLFKINSAIMRNKKWNKFFLFKIKQSS